MCIYYHGVQGRRARAEPACVENYGSDTFTKTRLRNPLKSSYTYDIPTKYTRNKSVYFTHRRNINRKNPSRY